jgi:hypothetical protein
MENKIKHYDLGDSSFMGFKKRRYIKTASSEKLTQWYSYVT